MTIVWGILILLLLLVVFLTITLRISYFQKNLIVSLRIGPVKMILYPSRPRPKPKPAAVKPKTGKRLPPKEKKPPAFNVKAMIPAMGRAAVRFWKALRINRLALRLRLTSDDAAQLAIRYGQTHAALGLISPLLYKKLPKGRGEIEITPDFEGNVTTCDFALECSLHVRQILVIGIAFFIDVFKQRKGGQA